MRIGSQFSHTLNHDHENRNYWSWPEWVISNESVRLVRIKWSENPGDCLL